MPVYRFQMPDGSVARIQANTPDEGLTYATSLTQKAGASQDKGNRSAADQQTYLSELQSARAASAKNPAPTGGALGKLNSFAAGEVGPIAGELIGGLRGGGNMAANLYRRATGKPQVSSRAIYEANRDQVDEETARETSANPVSAGTGSVAGLLSAGGEIAKGVGLLKDLPAVVKAGGALKALPGATRTAAAVNAAKAAAASRIAPKVLDRAGRIGGAMASGGAAGGALGFAEGSDLDERIQNAAHDAKWGIATGGVLEGLVAPVVKPFIGVGMDALRGAGRMLAPKVDEAVTSAADRIAAQQAVGRMAKAAGVNSGNLGARTAGYADLDQTAAEALGSTGQNILGATARRAGTTGDNLRSQMRQRVTGQPSAIVADFKDMLGVDPQAAAGNVQHMVDAGRKKAGPEFKDYFDSTQGGITSPEIERLLATPEGAKQAGGIERFAKNTGRPQSGLTFGRVETPETAAGVHPMEAPPVGEFSEQPPAAPRGPANPPPRGLSLLDWVRRQGGVGGEGAGEMAKMDLEKVGSRSQLSPKELDDLAQRAHDAGYFSDAKTGGLSADTTDNYHVVTGDDLLEAVRQEVAGQKVRYPRAPDPAAQARFEARQRAEQDRAQYDQRHVEPPVPRDEHMSLEQPGEPPPAGYGGREAPRYEPALQESLTGEALDRIRRRANKSVKWEFGKPVMSGEEGVANEEPAAFSEDFTAALKNGPYGDKLAKALETSSDYLGIQTAFNDGKGQLTGGTARAFGKYWASLKEGGQRDAARAAMASDVIDLWGKGQLRGGKFSTPDVKAKLELAFGKEGAREFTADVSGFVQRMDRRAELAASGNRMAPFSGSPTMSLQEAAGATDEMAPLIPPVARIAGKVASGNLAGAAGDTLKTLLGAYRKTAGTTTGFRNELGRILSLPSDDPEFVKLLRDFETATPAQRADFLARMGVPGDRATRAGVIGAVAQHGSEGDPERR